MNHIYNIIFNRALGLYQVVSEHTRSKSRGQKRRTWLTGALCIAQLFLLLSAGSVQAATHNVTSNSDNSASDTLRGILDGVNGPLQSGDIIVIDNAITSITLYTQPLPLQDNIELTINTSGQALTLTQSAAGKNIFNANNAPVHFGDKITFTKGNLLTGNGGAISGTGNSTFTFGHGTTFTGNKALDGSGPSTGNGGAISGTGNSTFTFGHGTTFTDNEANSHGGGIYLSGGAGSTLNIKGASRFEGNKSGEKGGAIYFHTDAIANFTADTGDILFRGNTQGTGATPGPNSLYLNENIDLQLGGDQNIYFDDPISSSNNGNNKLTKTGAGFVQFMGFNVLNPTSSGNVDVSTGGFRMAGALAKFYSPGSAFTVSNGAWLGGNGKISADSFSISGEISPDNYVYSPKTDLTQSSADNKTGSAIGSLTLDGGVFLSGATLVIDIEGTNSDKIYVGSLTHGPDTSTIKIVGSLGLATYNVLFSSTAIGDPNVNFKLQLPQPVGEYSYIARGSGMHIINNNTLQVTLDNTQNIGLTWNGDKANQSWSTSAADTNWTNQPGGTATETRFKNGDIVNFDGSVTGGNITINAGGVGAAAIYLSGDQDYAFSGGEIILTATSTLGTALATGYLEKQGKGTLTFNNQVTGDGHIYGGTMIIGDSIVNNNARFSGNVDIYSGATLGGHGQIAGMVTAQSGATIAPGNSIGTLSVGAIIFQSGSTYEFEGNTDGSGDKIIASNLLGGGTALINSGVNLSILAGAGTWNASTTYSILETDNGVQGQFDHIQTNLSFLTPSLNYSDPNKVGLTLSRNDERFSNAGITYNQRNTGFGIENLNVGHPVYNQIVSMNNEQAQNAFDNLSGEIHASIKSAALNNSRYTRNAINQHLTLNAGEAPEAERNLWVNTWYHDGHLKGDSNAQKLDNKGFGIMMGVDALSYGATTLGVALGYEQAELKLGGSQSSSADMDSMHLMAYGRTKAGPIDIRGAIGYSLLDIESKRNIGVGSLIGTNKADYDGSLIQAYIEGSHTFKATNAIDITPYINLAYQRVKTDSFTESAGLYSLGSQLKHKGRSDSQTSTTLGVRGLWRINNISDLYADIGWQHTFGRQTPESTFNFIGGQPYRIKGVKTNRNAAVLGIGANFQLTPNMQLSFGYEGHLGNQSRDHSAKLQWRLNF